MECGRTHGVCAYCTSKPHSDREEREREGGERRLCERSGVWSVHLEAQATGGDGGGVVGVELDGPRGSRVAAEGAVLPRAVVVKHLRGGGGVMREGERRSQASGP